MINLPFLKRYASIPLADYFLYRQLRKYYRLHQPDIVLHFTIKPNIFGSMAAKHEGVFSVATITGLGTTWLNGRVLKWMTQLLYRYSLPMANIVVGQNAHDIEALQKIGVVASKWQLIPGSGVDTDYFCADAVKKEGVFTFLFIGRMLIDKGLSELFSAWRQVEHMLPQAELHLLGDFDDSHPRCISKDIWQQGVKLPRLIYHPFKKDVRPFIRESDVVILPSYREGIPRSLLEAMAMKRPIIATDAPGCRELAVPGKNGWRIHSRSSAELAEALLMAYRTSLTERENYGEAGRKMIMDGYSNKIVAAHYLEIIQELISKKKD